MFLINALIFLAVLSLLIFVHELGHFLAAKACGVYVDRFSIGMPPRLFGKRLGETDYCVGALPIGGYVKMAGQEDVPLDEEERQREYGHVPPERWFNKKPVWQRFVVAGAGPGMNLVLGVILYTAMVAVGGEVPESELSSRIGMVEPDSPAATAPLYLERPGKMAIDDSCAPDAVGWQTGDLILKLNGVPLDNFVDLAVGTALGGPDKTYRILLERTNRDNFTTRYVSLITPKLFEGEKNPRFGVAPFETALVGDVIDGMPAKAAGLQKGDIIVRADGVLVDSASFVALTEKSPPGTPIDLEIRRGGKVLHVSLTPQTIGRFRGLALERPDKDGAMKDNALPTVRDVTKEFQEKTGIRRRDVIAEVDGQPATLALIDKLERENPGKELRVKVHRPAILFGLLQQAAEIELSMPSEPVRAIGVGLERKLVFHRSPPSEWIPEGFRQCYRALELTLSTVKALIWRDVSPREIGGPLMIAGVITKAAQGGFFWLLKFTAFISVNLCVVNLLPLPMLDGGLLVVHGYEGLRGKPLSVKVQERYQQFGLLFIVAMMLFVTWNDIWRWVDSIRP